MKDLRVIVSFGLKSKLKSAPGQVAAGFDGFVAFLSIVRQGHYGSCTSTGRYYIRGTVLMGILGSAA
jgi:hypothetical protein